MMNADDDLKLTSLTTNENAILDSFGSFTIVQPVTLLPPPPPQQTSSTPSTNYFQPIHQRPPSAASSSVTSSASVEPSPNKEFDSSSFFKPSHKQTLSNSSALFSAFPPQPASSSSSTNSLGAFFDNPSSINANPLLMKPPPLPSLSSSNITPPIMASPLLLKPNTTSTTTTSTSSNLPPPTLFAPIASKPPSEHLPPPPSNSSGSTLPPPVSVPPMATSISTSSNPYAAKGALNKKVYDPLINVAHIAPNQIPILTPSTVNSPAVAVDHHQQASHLSNIFIPPPQTTESSTIQAPSIQTMSNQPLPFSSNSSPLMSSSLTFPLPSSEITVLNDNYSSNNQQQQQPSSSGGGNKWNWFSQNRLLNTFVEKAKHSVESIVTTVDPQMKEYIHPANRPLYLICTQVNNPKLEHTIRESFNNAGFSKIATSSVNAQPSSQFAPEIVGYPCALKAAREKLDNASFYLQQTDCTIISIQDFIAELSTECWYELAVLILKDKSSNVELTVFTEALPVPIEQINQLQQYTHTDYPLKWSGFSSRLPEKNFNFNSNQLTFYDTLDTQLSQNRIASALKSLALLFKSKLLAQAAPNQR